MHPLTLQGTNDAVVNDHEVRIVGMSRSGNHAIINWILAQAVGRTCHLNCVEPKTNPFRSARPARGCSWRATYDFDVRQERKGNLSPKDLLLYNYEDCFLGLVGSVEFEAQRARYVGPSARQTDILILRDPFNLFASRKRGIHSPVPDHIAVRIWKQHARAVLRGTRHLGPTLIPILYNRWVCDRAYREGIAAALGLTFTDAGRNEVAAVGGGSSFDGLQFDGHAERMDVFNRWRHYADDPGFRALFDEDVASLTERVFSGLPDAARAPLRRAADGLGLAEPDDAPLSIAA